MIARRVGGLALCFSTLAGAQGFGSLKNVKPPEIPGIERYVRDPKVLVALGKALFWDMQVGSDGRTACATCHFHAGADHRAVGLTAPDFPFRVFADWNNNRSTVLRDSTQRAGSPGVTQPNEGRLTTPRNAPTVINAAFHPRVFLDGRAAEVFSIGDFRLEHSTLASQAIEPPLNTIEMAYPGRTWEDIARKLLPARPLDGQTVAADDSVLGPYTDPCCRGLATTYRALIRTAFQPTYVEADELNFPLFFALAIQAYEATLIADDTPFDRFLEGRRTEMTNREISGFLVFQTKAFCQFCHSGPEMSRSSATFLSLVGAVDAVQSGSLENVRILFTDTGFAPTGVRPATEDPGLDVADSTGAPVSIAARSGNGPLAIAGAFKVPGLRNVEFTGPYFHNGGQATLEQVVDFYARGGDFPDTPGLPVQLGRMPMTDGERADLATFLRSGLTDDRVRFERAPFDHPELCVADGSRWVEVPAVGRGGNAAPLQTFEELLMGIGADGSRAHSLTEACRIP
jgi:cytochrome c peroxidase